jgi:hypothetical protein
VYLWNKTNGRILPAVAFTSVFTAASAVNIGSIGISCWLFTLFLFGSLRVLLGHRPWRIAPGYNRWAMLALLIFVSYAALSAVVFPFLFAGTMVARGVTAAPLEWGIPNLAQLCYLLAALVLYLLAVSSPIRELQDTLEWYVRGCVVAAVIAIYQLFSVVAHIPYPASVLYSNKSYVIFHAYQINGLWRLNSTFTEASDMAGFMIVGIALLGWAIVIRPLRFSRTCCFILLVAALFMTQSSVGYVTLLFLLAIGSIIYAVQILSGRPFSPNKVVIGVAIVGVLVATFSFSSVTKRTTTKAIDTAVFQKQTTDSYRARTLTHQLAVETLRNTYYLGAGWGSVRPSGLLYVMLANAGILGLTMFLIFIFLLFLPLLHRIGQSPSILVRSSRYAQVWADSPLPKALFSMTMLLATMALAGSEIGTPILWVLFGIATVSSPSNSLEDARSDAQ